MELQTISEVSRQFGVSTRTLRYYEQIGLIQPAKKEDFAYRVYDEETVLRLRQILLLRKLRIPLKDIAQIVLTQNTTLAIEVFEQNLREIGGEITALSTIKGVITSFIERLNLQKGRLPLLDDESLLEIVDSLTASKISFKEAKPMDDVNQANRTLSRLTDNDVRIVYLPPATVASIHRIGATDPDDKGGVPSFYPEDSTEALMRAFIKAVDLHRIKPDFRHYGFNHPDGSSNGGPGDDHGYERWVTIPDDLEVEAPFVKKHFPGGLYAAHAIMMGAFEQWDWLYKWGERSERYDIVPGDPECMHGLLEEHLNVYNYYLAENPDSSRMQLDLLLPVKEKGKEGV